VAPPTSSANWRGPKRIPSYASPIKSLGLVGGEHSSTILKSLYESDANLDVRHAVINALFLHNDAKTLVALGRAEKNPDLRKSIVTRLSIMHSKDAADFLLDILNEQ
jgi:hypothetical protein